MSFDRFGDYSNIRRRPGGQVDLAIAPPRPAISELIVPGLADGASVLPDPVEATVVKERRYPIVAADWGDGFEPGPVS